jgi:flagellar basal-body rod protein FlgC
MSNVAAIALSGMNAATKRLDVSASNVANQRSNGRLSSTGSATTADAQAAYTPLRVDQVEVAGGTQANVSAVSPATVPAYDPQAPYADAQGMVATPNVDVGTEMIDVMLAHQTFAANVKVLKSSNDMTKTVLDMKV